MLKKTFFPAVKSGRESAPDVNAQRAKKKERLMANLQAHKKSPAAISKLYGQYMAHVFPEEGSVKTPLKPARNPDMKPEVSAVDAPSNKGLKGLANKLRIRSSVCHDALLTAMKGAKKVAETVVMLVFNRALSCYAGVCRTKTHTQRITPDRTPGNGLSSSLLFTAVR